MFKFLKELKDSFVEGYNEVKQELEDEEMQETQEDKIFIEVPSLENLAIAFSCPFRDVLISGELRRLFYFDTLNEKDKNEAQKLIKRDFDIVDEGSLKDSLNDWNELLPSDEHIVFFSSICLYQITTSVDIGYVKFEDYQDVCKRFIKDILMRDNVLSWQSFADEFASGDTINNVLGKKIIKRSIKSLLQDEDSPWNQIKWEDIKVTLDELGS